MPARWTAGLLSLLTLMLASILTPPRSALAADDWPEFRGPAGNGVSAAKGLPLQWSDSQNVAWKQAIPGQGWSSPAIVGGKILLTAAVANPKAADQLALGALCLDAKSGKTLWATPLFDEDTSKSPKIHPKNSRASPSPLVYGGRVFVHFGHMGTACLDLQGKPVWKTSELSYAPVHGNGGSPILVGKLLILNCDGASGPFVAALDAASGKVAWKTPRSFETEKKFSFCTPQLITVSGKPQVISPGSNGVMSLDPATGKEIWRVRYEGYSVIPRPVFDGERVYLSTGYDSPSVMAIRVDGQGDVTGTHVAWTLKKAAPHTPSLLLSGERLYLVSDGGIASCLEAATGKEIWQHRLGGNFSASPLLADGRIYFQSEDGVTTVVRDSATYEQLAQNKLGEKTLASFAVYDNDIFLRTESHLYRFHAP